MDKLRVAFFGSDAFSVASLTKLAALKSHISSLHVYTRSIKPTGRNLKTFSDVPVGVFAQAHQLPLFRVDSPSQILALADPNNYDLAIAVSYGILIPGALVRSLRYGGLNVHPSKLKQLSGAAPIQHCLMQDLPSTAVTVQTLHPTKFDHGAIVAQTPDIPVLDSDNYALLLPRLAAAGADLLASVITSGAYINPLGIESPVPWSAAPKTTPAMSEIPWATMTSRQIRRRFDALAEIHSYKEVELRKKNTVSDMYKVIFGDVREVSEISPEASGASPGDFWLQDGRLCIKTADSAVSAGKVKLQYCGFEAPSKFMASLAKRTGNTPHRFLSKRHLAL